MSHKVIDTDLILDTFSAYPAWLYADTFIVVAPEHPLVPALVKGQETETAVTAFVADMAKRTAIERGEAKEKIGIFTGRFADNPFKPGEKMPVWLANFALMDFGTGIIRCSAHDERDIEFAKKYAIPLRSVVGSEEEFINAHDNTGTLHDSGPFSGKEISARMIGEMVDWMEKEGLVRRNVAYRLRDWVFSRQRYWGEPIPIIHCEKCGAVPVPEKDLPVLLPEVEHYEPSGTGESPLANIEEWVNVACPKCGGAGKRETNTMPQWAGSSWYYIAYCISESLKSQEPISKQIQSSEIQNKIKYWLPVDMYVGGAEHATRHLIYARFWHKFLYDIGAVSTLEPFEVLHSVGLIIAEDGRKMSKRFGNVINPDSIVAEYGADTLRVYEMFMGPFSNAIAWNTQSLIGSRRFLERVWKQAQRTTDDEQRTTSLETELHRTIRKVGEDIDAFKFNTAIAQMMICLNAMEKGGVTKAQWRTFLLLLAPFAPHIAEELWTLAGEPFSVHMAKWPKYDADKVDEDVVTVAIQVNGKLRATIEVGRDTGKDELEAMARQALGGRLPNAKVSRTITVQNRLVNFVVDPK